jgi:hypothetical protein
MAVIDDILLEWSYRCSDGIVDMNNPTKREILNVILEENGVDLNEAIDSNYDEVIKDTLKKANLLLPNGDIPPVKEKYVLGNPKSLNKDDEEIFSKLYGAAPSTKTGDERSKGSGNGEIAMYWLFKYQNPPYIVTDTRGGNNPDLRIGKYGVEIKTGDVGRTKIGRIGGDTESLKDLNTVLGIDALISNFEVTGKKSTPPNSFNVSVEELKKACEHIFNLYSKMDSLEELADVFNVDFIKSILTKLKDLKKKYPKVEKADDLAAELLRSFIKHKISLKPGAPGYIATVSNKGPEKYTEIIPDDVEKKIVGSLNKITNDSILQNAELKQGTLVFKSDLFA